MIDNEYPAYVEIVSALEPVLQGFPGVIVAVDGSPGVGKSTLGRYLAWRFQVSLIETDWFLIHGRGSFTYRSDELRRVIEHRVQNRDRPAIVDGAVILRVLSELGMRPDFSIRLKRSGAPKTITLRHELARYHRDYPDEQVDLVIQL